MLGRPLSFVIVLVSGLLLAFAMVAYLWFSNPMDFVSQACPVPIASRADILSSGCLQVGELLALWVGFFIPFVGIGFALLATIGAMSRDRT
jgi:hypothetical protein